MKLIDLHPQWIALSPFRRGMGINFKCPHCPKFLTIMFWNPLDGGYPLNKDAKWIRDGENFYNLTISPKIEIEGHWSGTIQDGYILP